MKAESDGNFLDRAAINFGVYRAICIIAVIAMLSGCVPLPIPTKTRVTPRMYGKVVDVKNGRAIGGAMVKSEQANFSRVSVSNENGSYSIDPISQQHFLLLVGGPIPVKYPLVWYNRKALGDNPTRRRVSVSAPGYWPRNIEYGIPSLKGLSSSEHEKAYEKLFRDGLKLDIKMRPNP